MLARLVRGCLGYEWYHVYGWEAPRLTNTARPLHAEQPERVKTDRIGADHAAIESLPRSWWGERLTATAELERAVDPELAALAAYAGADARLYALRQAGQLIAACAFWSGDRYRRRKSWRLAEGEAKLVQLTTATAHRGQGAATALIRYAAGQMAEAGFDRLYARVWHSHVASRRAFESAGWHRVGFLVGVNPLGLARCRFRLAVRRAAPGRSLTIQA